MNEPKQPPPAPVKKPPPTPAQIGRVNRAIEIMDFRLAGASYFEIAAHFGITRQAAHAAVQSALDYQKDKLAEKVEQVRTMELRRLDMLQVAVWEKALDGDDKAQDRVLDIMSMRAKYTGAHMPVKVAPTDPSGEKPYDQPLTDEERSERVAAMVDAARARRDRLASVEEPGSDPGGGEPC